MKFWKTEVKDLEGLEKYYKNDDILLDRDKNAALNISDEGLKILNKTGQELPVEPVDTEKS